MSRRARAGASVLVAVALLLWFRLRVRLPWALRGRGLLGRAAQQTGSARPWPAPAGTSAARLVRLFAHGRAWVGRGVACLPRSLALARFLELHGLHARVCLGLARREGRLAGHAWVEHDCAVVGDEPAFVATFLRLQPIGRGGESR